ncbi:hypothetical protein JHK82_049593 [Glycine max]|nr:hypothetical protein JHK86_049460 [Glycine max]KAG4935301.1 hypothetical protein JHK85_050220 [Glycine max]KAG5090815.1 hypothetical protein JHK82_049593 [Glycine max]KAG5093906.1 hypothetical protein JHK84_049494 [Glycine max]
MGKKMAPSGRTTTASTRTTSKTTTTTRRTRQQRRTTATTTNFKKKQHNTKSNNKKQQEQVLVPTVLPSSCSSSSISSQDSSNSKEVDNNMHGSAEVIDVVCNSNTNSPCSTPKGQKFRIPEISTCPPAPKKPRVLSNCSLRRSPLSFFAPPDLEHFFFVALRDVSV